MKKISEHFTEDECKCNCGCGTMIVQPLFLARLEIARVTADCVFHITSWTRCPDHNAIVGGKTNSSHLTGWAADIKVTSFRNRATIMYGLLYAGFNRIGIGTDFIHVDCDPVKKPVQLWFY